MRTSTKGICGVGPDAWRACAKSNSTDLHVSMVDDLLDKQSVANARTHFSENVETWMRQNGHTKAAELTRLIRRWYEASDSPSICAESKICSTLEIDFWKV